MSDGMRAKPPDLDAIRARAEEAFLVGSHGTASGVWFADVTEEDVREDARNTLALLAEIERLREALGQVRLVCLLNVRRAAFAPTIGVRYNETIRADIADECARLELFVDAALAAQESAE